MKLGKVAAIRAALTGKTTGLTSAEIREKAAIDKLGSALFGMVKSGEIIKHKGETERDTRYSLDPNRIADAPRAAKKSKKKKSRRAAPPQRSTKATARKTPAPAARTFIPAITVDQELVLVDRGADPSVRIFSAEDTQAVAQLMLSNFTA